MKKIIFPVLVLLLVYAMLMAYCHVHESLHVLVYRNVGVSSSYNMTWFGTGYTYITNMSEYDVLPLSGKAGVRDMQTYAEIVGYNSMMSSILVIIMLALQVIVFVMSAGDRGHG